MIDPGFLAELDRFDTSLKRVSNAPLQGDQRSPDVGEGLTFSDHRRYAPGDDPRLIDWKAYARTEELFIKRFEAERNLTVHVLLDATASMDFGESDLNKFEYGAKLGLGFCHLTAEDNNDFQFSLIGDVPDRIDTDASSRGEVLRLVNHLNETTPTGDGDITAALEEYAETIRSRSLILVVSDLLFDPDDVAAGLTALARNDVVVAQVLTPEEIGPEATGDAIFEDPESDAIRRTYFGGTAARRYSDRLQAHLDDVEERCQALGIERELVDTGGDFFDTFAGLWLGARLGGDHRD
ncbi:DUF58 domain-containing protein [Haloferax mediterranei ATCC 33500]|uniref:DUF58 domain-containing protein n=1 Tax=Haloferax mediterranei (strain ATCC 33500 / DSM 1411 / JCM 8866 / NBRC 14739 / NCIMB 2177 / R-4) TaxID=523841 RepID=I3R417_HALMT|nr:DUF58 domain-containing protein [Haloferax mediterranei]AFK18977.1 hypothetical protein HFX_1264 [Haloferax mediterranei ATCC 33500]AHZ21663.1 hypothetical protein BM92_02875 [Haloferax mediterranei ATCC 33500]EMA03165.1 hypothetical protein C439_04185 [Haloferax mediterranei ATCC 33500]MDX5989068.1 DUF58 domain-containing protein [Haloferax mediterranei ATCC 33500]QCQ75458.1 DUF58 domain-containing protein [Haloferax mediterranei ATCC 33500]